MRWVLRFSAVHCCEVDVVGEGARDDLEEVGRPLLRLFLSEESSEKLTLCAPGYFNPLRVLPSEVLGRSHPQVWDIKSILGEWGRGKATGWTSNSVPMKVYRDAEAPERRKWLTTIMGSNDSENGVNNWRGRWHGRRCISYLVVAHLALRYDASG